MRLFTTSLLSSAVVSTVLAAGTIDSSLVGTWTTKSRKVFTGPGFYDPVNDKMIEPALTGISYSFTADGFYEEAYYRAIPNPTNPQCPQGLIQWQHGTVTAGSDGGLVLTPIQVDGRQLLSDPCNHKTASFSRYNQTETFVKYEQYVDPYNAQQRLDLYEWDGTPVNPMWLAYRPPEMLPTTTLNPYVPVATGAPGASSSAGGTTSQKVRRNLGLDGEVVEEALRTVKRATGSPHLPGKDRPVSAMVFWVGLFATGIGGILFIFAR